MTCEVQIPEPCKCESEALSSPCVYFPILPCRSLRASGTREQIAVIIGHVPFHKHIPFFQCLGNYRGYSKATYLWSPVFPVMLKAPKARSEHTACVYQGALYVLGGRGACSPFKDFWKYDLGEIRHLHGGWQLVVM